MALCGKIWMIYEHREERSKEHSIVPSFYGSHLHEVHHTMPLYKGT